MTLDCEILELFIIINSELFSFLENSGKKIENPQNSRKNSKLKGRAQFFGTFICWLSGKDGQTISPKKGYNLIAVLLDL